ncbi:MAG TPA: ABC transporter permease [Baekduia sp.]|nr:ABC transporter permease [Baekduia sp.]
MKDLVVFILLGLGPAALIATLAVALVVQYKGSGMIDLSLGGIATFGGYAFYEFSTEQGWSTLPALLTGMAAVLLLGFLLERFVYRKVRAASPLAKLVVSLGVLLSLQATFVLVYGTDGQRGPEVFPHGSGDVLTVFDTPIPTDRLYVVAIVAVVSIGLALVYKYTRFGQATRAAAESETSAVIMGLAPQRLAMWNTLLATGLAGGFGMLVASQTNLDSTTVAFAVVPALGAALLGGFTSVSVAALAGLAIGIAQTVLLYLQSKPWFPASPSGALPGVAPLLTFVVIVGALWFRGDRLPTRGTLRPPRLPPAPEPKHLGRWTVAIVVIGLLALMLLPPDLRQASVNTMVAFLLALSLVVIVGFVGQLSLMQVAIAGVAAFAVQKLAVRAGIPFPVAPLLAIAGAVLVGLVTALPALRVRGVSLAIATLAAAVVAQDFVFANPDWGQNSSSSLLPPPSVFGLELGPTSDFPGWNGKLPSPVPGLMVLAVATVVAVFVGTLRKSVLGQHMLAVRSNESAAAAAGVNVRNIKLTGFAIAAGIAGIAGVVAAYSKGSVDATDYGVFAVLSIVAFAYLSGITTMSGALIAGLFAPSGFFTVGSDKLFMLDANWFALIGGIGLVATIVYYPDGWALAQNEQFRGYQNRWNARRSRKASGNTPDAEVAR